MQKRRGMDNLKNLTNGPGKLTKALGITMNDYGHSFSKPPLYIIFRNRFLMIFPSDHGLELTTQAKQKIIPIAFGLQEIPLYLDIEKQETQNHESPAFPFYITIHFYPFPFY